MKNFARFLVVASLLASSVAFAADPAPFQGRDENVLRLSGTLASYSKLSPITSAYGFGVDYGSYFANGFAVIVQFRNQFSSTESTFDAGTSTNDSASARLYGFTPTYSLRSGSSRMSFGLFVGAMSISAETRTVVSTTSTTTDASKSYFAIGPSATIDYFVSNRVAISLGAIFVATTVDPKPSMFVGNFGIGFSL